MRRPTILAIWQIYSANGQSWSHWESRIKIKATPRETQTSGLVYGMVDPTGKCPQRSCLEKVVVFQRSHWQRRQPTKAHKLLF